MGLLRKGINDLETWCEQHGEQGQRILEEWDIEENFKQGMHLAPCDFTYGSNVEIFWKCRDCGHQWKMPIAYRTLHGTNCCECHVKEYWGKRIENLLNKKQDLLSYCEQNGDWGKRLIAEWDKDYNLKEYGATMATVVRNSGNKYRWKCSICGRYFFQAVNARTGNMRACKMCCTRQTSFPEQFIFWSLSQIYPETRSRELLFDKMEYDIFVPELKLCIEYSGDYWHANRRERDCIKKEKCLANGIRFIEILEGKDYENLKFDKNRVEMPRKSRTYIITYLIEIVEYIVDRYDKDKQTIDFKKAENIALDLMYKRNNNVASIYPQLLLEWDDVRKPESCSIGACVVIHWKCAKCGHKFMKDLYQRIHKKSGCPICGYSSIDGKIHKRSISKTEGHIFSLQQYV